MIAGGSQDRLEHARPLHARNLDPEVSPVGEPQGARRRQLCRGRGQAVCARAWRQPAEPTPRGENRGARFPGRLAAMRSMQLPFLRCGARGVRVSLGETARPAARRRRRQEGDRRTLPWFHEARGPDTHPPLPLNHPDDRRGASGTARCSTQSPRSTTLFAPATPTTRRRGVRDRRTRARFPDARDRLRHGQTDRGARRARPPGGGGRPRPEHDCTRAEAHRPLQGRHVPTSRGSRGLALPDEGFDAVFSATALHWVKMPTVGWTKAARMLHPGGTWRCSCTSATARTRPSPPPEAVQLVLKQHFPKREPGSPFATSRRSRREPRSGATTSPPCGRGSGTGT